MRLDKNGFTIAEVIIVLSVMAIITGIAIPSAALIEKRQLNMAALNLRSDIRSIQRLAMAEGVGTIISIYPERNMYVLSKQTASKTDVDISSGNYTNIKTAGLPENIEFVASALTSEQISYTINGTVAKANRIDLKSKNYVVKMTVNVGAGHVKIYEAEKLKE